MPDQLKIISGFGPLLTRLQKASALLHAEMAHAVEEVASQARLIALEGLNQGVYGTAPGRYVRTNELAEKLHVEAVAAPARYTVVVENESEHAVFVEYGTYGQNLTPAQAQVLADALGDKFAPLYLGRSGANWQAPNPAHMRAAVWAGHRLQQLFSKALVRVLS